MKIYILVMLLLLMAFVLIAGCDSYTNCKSDCLRYQQNCTEQGALCVPAPCPNNRTCLPVDMARCLNVCGSGQNG
jgi:hypothetical protein